MPEPCATDHFISEVLKILPDAAPDRQLCATDRLATIICMVRDLISALWRHHIVLRDHRMTVQGFPLEPLPMLLMLLQAQVQLSRTGCSQAAQILLHRSLPRPAMEFLHALHHCLEDQDGSLVCAEPLRLCHQWQTRRHLGRLTLVRARIPSVKPGTGSSDLQQANSHLYTTWDALVLSECAGLTEWRWRMPPQAALTPNMLEAAKVAVDAFSSAKQSSWLRPAREPLAVVQAAANIG